MHSFLSLICSGFLLLITSSLLTTTFAVQNDKDIYLLELNKPVERELAGGQSHSYKIVLAAGQYLRVVVEQHDADVVLTLFDPKGKRIVDVDLATPAQGPEQLLSIAEISGNYRLEVRSFAKDMPVGQYAVTLTELRTATTEDQDRVAAEQTFIEGEQLRLQGTAESLRTSIEKYEISLPLFRAVGDRLKEATTLYALGFVSYELGENQKALDYYGQALSLFRTLGDRSGEAATLASTGATYDALGEKQKALNFYEQAVPLLREVGDRGGEASTLSNIGLVYDSLGEKQKALDYYGQSLSIKRSIGDQSGEATTLGNIGKVYEDLGERQKALEYYEQALRLSRLVRDQRNEATTLNNIGFVYYLLGEYRTALDYYGQSLSLLRIVGDSSGEARTLSNIGVVYGLLGDRQKALDYYRQALPLLRAVGDRLGEAAAFNSMGTLYQALGENDTALNYYGQSLSLFHAVGERKSEARVLGNIGTVYDTLGERQKALDYFVRSLPLSRAVGDRSAEATTLTRLTTFYETLNRPRLAVFFSKQSVDAYQELRSNTQGLDKEVQKTYLKSVAQAYRGLITLLIQQSRSAEAQQVLNAFKDQQFFDFDQTQTGKLTQLIYTPRENEFRVEYEKTIDNVAAIGGKVAEFKRKIGDRHLLGEDARQLQQLEEQLTTASKKFFERLKRAETGFSGPVGETDKVGEVADTTQMQAALRELKKDTGQTTVAVYTLVGETRFYALVITAGSITAVSSNLKGAELNEKARQLWGLLQSDTYDPRVLSHDLYNAIFKPLKEKLPVDTKTILWSLDGNLRYLPMGVLYDGKQYLVERYNHVNFTRADSERMTRAPSRQWTGLGLGSSRGHTVELLGTRQSFEELPGVAEELRAVFRAEGHAGGVLEGEVLPDEKFTKSAMLAGLGRRRPVVHIASHFSFRPGDETRSFLLLGDGSVLTLAEMKAQRDLFGGVELLTLSACNTAAQQADADGREIDAFAELAQRLGANAVMATLWPLADESAPWLMREFYRNRQAGAGMMKAEALRKAQLALLRGSARISASNKARKAGPIPVHIVINPSVSQRGEGKTRADIVYVETKHAPPYKREKLKPFAHPYYWAPVILVGNLR